MNKGRMNERQRQDYLEAMGIQTWFPRFVLPAAKPSHTCDWDDTDSPVEAFTDPAPAMEAALQPAAAPFPPQGMGYIPPQNHYTPPPAGGVLKESSDILGELGFATTPDESQDKKETSASKSQTTDTDITPAEPFRLAAIDVNEHCLAVVDLPWSGLNQFTGYHERLLRGILKAVQLPCDQELQTGVFAWPMIQETTPVDRKYAQEAVRCFLTNQFGLQRRKTVLLFGRNSGTCLWSGTFDTARGIQEKDGVTYAITCSLGEMMGIPELKAEAWADLKGLCKAS